MYLWVFSNVIQLLQKTGRARRRVSVLHSSSFISDQSHRPIQPLRRTGAGHDLPCVGVSVGDGQDSQGAEGGESLLRPGGQGIGIGKGGNGVLHGVADDVGENDRRLGAGNGVVGLKAETAVHGLAANIVFLDRVGDKGTHGGGDVGQVGKVGSACGGGPVRRDTCGLHGGDQELHPRDGLVGLEVGVAPHLGAVHQPHSRDGQDGGGVGATVHIGVGHRGRARGDRDADGGRGAVIAVAVVDHVVKAVLADIACIGGVHVSPCVAIGEGDPAVGGVADDLVGDLIPLGVVGRDRAGGGESLVGLDVQSKGGSQGNGGGVVETVQKAEAAGDGVIAPVDRDLHGGLGGGGIIRGGEREQRQASRRDDLPLGGRYRSHEQSPLPRLGEASDRDVVQLGEVHGPLEILGGEGDLVAAETCKDHFGTGGQDAEAVGHGRGGLAVGEGEAAHRGAVQGLGHGLGDLGIGSGDMAPRRGGPDGRRPDGGRRGRGRQGKTAGQERGQQAGGQHTDAGRRPPTGGLMVHDGSPFGWIGAVYVRRRKLMMGLGIIIYSLLDVFDNLFDPYQNCYPVCRDRPPSELARLRSEISLDCKEVST